MSSLLKRANAIVRCTPATDMSAKKGALVTLSEVSGVLTATLSASATGAASAWGSGRSGPATAAATRVRQQQQSTVASSADTARAGASAAHVRFGGEYRARCRFGERLSRY